MMTDHNNIEPEDLSSAKGPSSGRAVASDFDNTLYFMGDEEPMRAADIFGIVYFQQRGGLFGISGCIQTELCPFRGNIIDILKLHQRFPGIAGSVQKLCHQFSGAHPGESSPYRPVMSGSKRCPVKRHLYHALEMPVFQNGICQLGIGDAGASVTFLTANLNETGNGRIMRSFCLGKPNAVFRRDCIDIFRPLAGVKSEQHLLHGIFVMNSIENKFHGYSFVLPPKGTPVLR